MEIDKPYSQLQQHVQHKHEKLLRKKIQSLLNSLEMGPKQEHTTTTTTSNNNSNDNYNNNYNNNSMFSKDRQDRSLIPPHRRTPDEQQALAHALTEVTDLERTLLQADKDAIGFATKILDAVGRFSICPVSMSLPRSLPPLLYCLMVCWLVGWLVCWLVWFVGWSLPFLSIPLPSSHSSFPSMHLLQIHTHSQLAACRHAPSPPLLNNKTPVFVIVSCHQDMHFHPDEHIN